MQYFLFSFGKLHKYASVAAMTGLLIALMIQITMPFSAYAQDQKEAVKSADENTELTGLKERLRQLEERFINMQSRMGTIESMAGQGRSADMQTQSSSTPVPSQSGYGASNSAGMPTNERAGQGFRNSQDSQDASGGFSGRDSNPEVGQENIPAPVPTKPRRRRIDENGSFSPFGDQSSVQPGQNKAENKSVAVASAPAQQSDSGRLDIREKTKVLHAPSGLDSSSPKNLYQASYKMLLKPNYRAAEKGFSYFLQKYPKDKRASNAQYWLGESYFVQKKYKNAATAYLRGYKKYPNSLKAPDSFLKLAVSLKKLGQKSAACATFKAFPAKYPNATSYVKRRHKIMVRQAGC